MIKKTDSRTSVNGSPHLYGRSQPPLVTRNSASSTISHQPLTRTEVSPGDYTQPYLKFMTENPTVFHAVHAFVTKLEAAGYRFLSERRLWDVKPGGKYYTTRNYSALIAFAVGSEYKPGNGIAIVAGHIDALTTRLKPVSHLPTKAGYTQLAVAPYAGALNSTWWDRDLGIGGKVLIRKNGKVDPCLVKLDWPIARIPTLAPHFGTAAQGPFNMETQMVPIIGLDNSDITGEKKPTFNIKPGTFAATQSPELVQVITEEMEIDHEDIVGWELELFDLQPAQLGGIHKEFIFAGRVDDKLCCYGAVEGLLASDDAASTGIIRMVGCFDDEEIGSYLRQGARSNFMDDTIDRILGEHGAKHKGQVLANSFLCSSDVGHAVNPNFLNAYLENHMPRLNIGITVAWDSNGHMTTDSVSNALLTRVAEKCGSQLQVFQIRNDSRSGGTIGPMTSSKLGCRSIDCGMAQLSMHSIRATIGNLDPGLGVKLFKGFFDYYEEVDKEFQHV